MAIQQYTSTTKPIILFCELLKHGKLSITDTMAILNCPHKTARRHLQNIFDNVDRDQFSIEFWRDTSTIYESPVYLAMSLKDEDDN